MDQNQKTFDILSSAKREMSAKISEIDLKIAELKGQKKSLTEEYEELERVARERILHNFYEDGDTDPEEFVTVKRREVVEYDENDIEKYISTYFTDELRERVVNVKVTRTIDHRKLDALLKKMESEVDGKKYFDVKTEYYVELRGLS